jgi:hypothetical protein
MPKANSAGVIRLNADLTMMDVCRGTPGDAGDCPIRHAVRREIRRRFGYKTWCHTEVLVTERHLILGFRHAATLPVLPRNRVRIPLTWRAARFVHRYDTRRKWEVDPANFRFEVDARKVRRVFRWSDRPAIT